jgi:hypothetical protein
MSGDDDERRHAPTTTNPGSSILSKFIGYGSVDVDDEAEGVGSIHPPTSTNRRGWTTVLLWKLLEPLRLS